MKFACFFVACLLLIQISYVDYKTFMIPIKYNLCLGIVAMFRLYYFRCNLTSYIGAFLFMGIFLGVFFILSKGRMVGGGDVKLMMTAGLLLGMQKTIVAFFLGCLAALLCEGYCMKRNGKSRIFAMAPYLCIGIFCQIIV